MCWRVCAANEGAGQESRGDGLGSPANIFAPSSCRGSFSLDSPLYRRRLSEKLGTGRNLSGKPAKPGVTNDL